MLIHAILEGGATDDTKHLTVHVVFDIGTVPSNLQSKMYSFIDLFIFIKSYLLGGFFFCLNLCKKQECLKRMTCAVNTSTSLKMSISC